MPSSLLCSELPSPCRGVGNWSKGSLQPPHQHLLGDYVYYAPFEHFQFLVPSPSWKVTQDISALHIDSTTSLSFQLNEHLLLKPSYSHLPP